MMRALVEAMAASPQTIFRRLAEAAQSVCRAHSAGIAVLDEAEGQRRLRWRALAGVWAEQIREGTVDDFGPCAVVLDRNAPLLIAHPERAFPYLGQFEPSIAEGLFLPVAVDGHPIGTIWIAAHDEHRQFDYEDLRIMRSLAKFAEAACKMVPSVEAAKADDQKRATAVEAQRRLAAIVACSDDAIIGKSLSGIVQTWNGAAERLFGYSAEEMTGRPIAALYPPDRIDEESDILARLKRGERIRRFETTRRHKDGSLIDVSLTISPISDESGRLVGASSMVRDIRERKQAQEQQSLLLQEMRHRVKNLFTIASSIVALSARFSDSPQEMAAAIQRRLEALARAQNLTRPHITDSGRPMIKETGLHALIRAIFDPFMDQCHERRLALSGDDAPISGTAITNVALVLNELATNAVKYGALASDDGAVYIHCSLDRSALLLSWEERGAPVAAREREAEHQGFGSFLTHRIVHAALKGELERHWGTDGLKLQLRLPRAALTR